MNTKFLTTAAVLAFSLSTGAQASLVARTGGMVYDTINDITWAADANLAKTSGYDADGQMTWANAVAWADQLTLGGFTDWSLPTTVPAVPYYNQTGSQMGDLFYNQLGGAARKNIATTHNDNYNLFTHVQSYVYWSSSEEGFYCGGGDCVPNPGYYGHAWYFDTYGEQFFTVKEAPFFAWAVRPGDVPVPGAFWLFGTALVGLIGLKRRGSIG